MMVMSAYARAPTFSLLMVLLCSLSTERTGLRKRFHSRGEMGSPCLTPQWSLKAFVGLCGVLMFVWEFLSEARTRLMLCAWRPYTSRVVWMVL